MSGRSTEPWFVSTWAQIDTNVDHPTVTNLSGVEGKVRLLIPDSDMHPENLTESCINAQNSAKTPHARHLDGYTVCQMILGSVRASSLAAGLRHDSSTCSSTSKRIEIDLLQE